MASTIFSQSLFSNLSVSPPPIHKRCAADAAPLSLCVKQSRFLCRSHVVTTQFVETQKNFLVDSTLPEDGSSRAETPIELRYPAFPTVMDINKIREILPHRYPFLLVDRVIEYNPGVSAVGIKNVTINDDFFPGHFPKRPIMPGVLMVEVRNSYIHVSNYTFGFDKPLSE
ncbi:hypothetical protein F511_44867 [Dorcoceras hygrometricum]|uniref:Beta-hydroxyacyl-ACP dehydratase n=1 Tax=Dorcoceras hygrometricum TaxID=472368 RepID=A0A2Z6ZXV8_9LAMI|nr:hypothetical protein F511_44867 [Dorcoceras hygrometricum]